MKRVIMEEEPGRYRRQIGKQVLLPAGMPSGMKSERVMVEVRDVCTVVKAKEADAKEHRAACVCWVYDIRRTADGKGRLASCSFVTVLRSKSITGTPTEGRNGSSECTGNELRFGQPAVEAWAIAA